VEAASETTTDQEDQTKDRESGGERELTKGTGKPYLSISPLHHLDTYSHLETFIFHSSSVVAY